ncbi:unnamed protein product [Adineta steineri]|uniref:NHL repeat containing protein n=1 Tax=Adineta steineri TaxID=433720 RepID=A0A815Z1L8_9BILA|nr:unnamed protein product [Adineta steineri]
MKITQQLNNPSNTSIQQSSPSFINEISVIQLKTGGYGRGRGQRLNQLNGPVGIFIDDKKNIFIANSYNQRIVERKYNANEGQIVVGGNGQENQLTQLYSPCGLSFDHESNIYIADFASNRIQKFDVLV